MADGVEITIFGKETIEFIKNLIILNPELSFLFLITFLSGYVIYFYSSKKLNEYSPEGKLHIWDIFLWIVVFSFINLYFSIFITIITLIVLSFILPPVLGGMPSQEIVFTVDTGILIALFIASLIIIPSSIYLPKFSISKLIKLEIIVRCVNLIILGSMFVLIYLGLKYNYQGPLPPRNQIILLGIVIFMLIFSYIINMYMKKIESNHNK